MRYSHTMEYYSAIEWSTDTCYNMDGPSRHYAKQKKPVTNDHISYDFIHMKCP